jgi:HAD superfamily hydrolase (TIGR01549 family)
MTSYEAVLFDMDGVLLQGPATPIEVYENAADDAIEALELDVSESERTALRQYHYDEGLAAQCHELGVDPEEFWTMREQFASERANRRLGDGAREPYHDASAVLDLPVPVGVVSNNRHATVDFVASELFDGDFAVALGRDPTVEGFRRRKPESHYIERALADLGVDSALYVGDRTSDVTAARRAGIDGGFVRREHNSKMRFDRPPAVDIDGLDRLSGLFE